MIEVQEAKNRKPLKLHDGCATRCGGLPVGHTQPSGLLKDSDFIGFISEGVEETNRGPWERFMGLFVLLRWFFCSLSVSLRRGLGPGGVWAPAARPTGEPGLCRAGAPARDMGGAARPWQRRGDKGKQGNGLQPNSNALQPNCILYWTGQS